MNNSCTPHLLFIHSPPLCSPFSFPCLFRPLPCTRCGSHSREHHFQPRRVANAGFIFKPLWCDPDGLYFPSAFLAWSKPATYQSCPSQPHAEPNAYNGNGSARDEHARNGGPYGGPQYELGNGTVQSHGNAF